MNETERRKKPVFVPSPIPMVAGDFIGWCRAVVAAQFKFPLKGRRLK